MFLTKFLTFSLAVLISQADGGLFEDCVIEICSVDKVEMDLSGKFWPRYCYKCDEGEDEVIFMREYFINGWKYYTNDSYDLYQGRLVLNINPCNEPELDSMGNLWTSWCFLNKKVNFEKVGGRIWIYKQDYAGGYPHLQFRRVLYDDVFAQIHNDDLQKGKNDSNVENDSKTAEKNIDLNKEKTKIDQKINEFEEKTEKIKKYLENQTAKVYDKVTDELKKEKSIVSDKIKEAKEKFGKTDKKTEKIKLHIEETIKKSDNKSLKTTNNQSTQKIEENYVIIKSQSNANPIPSTNITKESEKTLKIISDSNFTTIAINQTVNISKPLLNPNQVLNGTFDHQPQTPQKPAENSEKNTENCRKLEGDKAGQYFYVEYSFDGNKINYELDSNNNFIYDPDIKSRTTSEFLITPLVISDDLVPCKIYNSQGALVELEPDLYVKNMFWEKVYENYKPVKYLVATRLNDKRLGMYLIDHSTGYRFRSFV